MRRAITAFVAALAAVLTFTATASAATDYRVQPGDTLFLIAQKYGISYQDLQAANSLNTSNIYPGQALIIPTKNPTSSQKTNTTYIVQPGDTLFLIAQKYGINYLQLQKANNLATPDLYPGQKLVISTTPATAEEYISYKVQRGDTLSSVSQKFGVSVSQIESLNGIKDGYLIAGQSIKVPAVRPATLASRGSQFSWRDLDLMARVVNGEARGEPFVGQVAVAAVILNRLRDINFPKSISGIVYQPWAFTAVNDGQINAPLSASAKQAVQAAIDGWDPTQGATYYWNPVTATNKWVWSRNILLQIGNHVFAK